MNIYHASFKQPFNFARFQRCVPSLAAWGVRCSLAAAAVHPVETWDLEAPCLWDFFLMWSPQRSEIVDGECQRDFRSEPFYLKVRMLCL